MARFISESSTIKMLWREWLSRPALLDAPSRALSSVTTMFLRFLAWYISLSARETACSTVSPGCVITPPMLADSRRREYPGTLAACSCARMRSSLVWNAARSMPGSTNRNSSPP